MASDIDYVTHIRNESARFAAALARADPSARVPTCPDWSAADLLWHLTEVQFFWAVIVRDRLDDPSAADALKPERPDDYEALLALFGRATTALIDAITTTSDEIAIWTWAPDQSVRFVRRWQAHEALMHRLDAELVTGGPTAIDPALATDGVDAALTFVHGDVPAWATFTPDGTRGRLEMTDTAVARSVQFGRYAGTSPNAGKVYDEETLLLDREIDSTPSAAFTVRGKAADLDGWLWGRAPLAALTVAGDRDAFARLEQIVGGGVQ